MYIDELINKLDKIEPWNLLMPIIKDSESDIIKINQDQLKEAKKSDGTTTKAYKPRYLAYKMTLPTYTASPNADLFNKGDSYKGMFVKVLDDGIEIGTTSKEKQLESRDGKEIFGIIDENKKKLGEVWTPKLVESMKRFINQ